MADTNRHGGRIRSGAGRRQGKRRLASGRAASCRAYEAVGKSAPGRTKSESTNKNRQQPARGNWSLQKSMSANEKRERLRQM